MTSKTQEFLRESNYIEGEYSHIALRDAHEAWAYAVVRKHLTLNDIKQIHYLLMRNLRPDIAGKWRTCDVYIGGERKRFSSIRSLEKKVSEWIEGLKINDYKTAHILFENIHPFEDGNGRTGRILMNWQITRKSSPLLIIHSGEEQMEYYKWFRKVGNKINK